MSDLRYPVFQSWSAQRDLDPLVIAGGEGAWFWDHDGARWLDFASQLINLNVGHQHPRVVAGIQEQAARLCMVAPAFGNDQRTELARRLLDLAPGDKRSVFFTNGGAEANEHAVRMARLRTGRHKVLTAYRSYHGATAGAIALTGDPRRWASEPGAAGIVRFFGPYLYRSAWGATTLEEECERSLAHLEQVMMMEGAHTFAAIVLEPVVGTNGILIPPPGYLRGVRDLCDRHGIMLIADEVMVGFGRCGRWFAHDREGVTADLIVFAKGVNSGYVPLGGVILSEGVAASFDDRAYPGGLTYSGHPLACAAALATLDVMQDDKLVERSARLGEEVVKPALEAMLAQHEIVGDVRGEGLFWAIELVKDKASREMYVPFNAAGADAAPMNDLMSGFKARGVWPFSHFNRIHVAPPLVIEEEDLRHGLAVIDEVLRG